MTAPVLLVVAAFSRHEEALRWGRERLEESYGPVALSSVPYLFNQTHYYEATMGADLRKQFFAFAELVSPDCLPAVKLRTNELERELAGSGTYPEPRPLNLDPGILSLGKFQLATTLANQCQQQHQQRAFAAAGVDKLERVAGHGFLQLPILLDQGEQLLRRNLQRSCNAHDVFQANVGLPAFHSTHVGAMNLGQIG